ncbi:MAG: hypothetical protein MI867_25575 [Pseudomonadales bacterium]|nr:hypothetical protein [Pseudomonadales bacterium]
MQLPYKFNDSSLHIPGFNVLPPSPPPEHSSAATQKRTREAESAVDEQHVISSKRMRDSERREKEENFASTMRNEKYGRVLQRFVEDCLLTEEEATAELKRTYPLPSDGLDMGNTAIPLLDGTYPASQAAIIKVLEDRKALAEMVLAGKVQRSTGIRMLNDLLEMSPVRNEVKTLFLHPARPALPRVDQKGEQEKGDGAVAMSILCERAAVDAETAAQAVQQPPCVKGEDVEVVDLLAGITQPSKTDIIIRLSSIWTVRTKLVPFPKGAGKGGFEVVSVERPIKDDKHGKVFGISIPMRFLCFVLNALKKISDSSECGPTPPPPTADELRKMVPDKFGVKDASVYSRSRYMRTKFVADIFTIQIRDVDYKNFGPGGNGVYEALSITKTQSVTEAAKLQDPSKPTTKDYSVNIPSRLLGTLKSAIEYIFEERCGVIKK